MSGAGQNGGGSPRFGSGPVAQAELERAYARVFDGPEGEAVFADLMRQGRLEAPIFSPDALELAHAEGRRSLALHVRRMAERGRAGGAIAGRAGS
ncbi:Bbp19 family protein [Paucidesulfovibrio longus]|uniref:Bbp19 family protein n=1 Tax=Paucidesulfovibrio longus TaxID=889 RepID=UPI0003B65474|nr:hypothetical protein [Paucidesulfovibrio longus]